MGHLYNYRSRKANNGRISGLAEKTEKGCKEERRRTSDKGHRVNRQLKESRVEEEREEQDPRQTSRGNKGKEGHKVIKVKK